MARPINYKGKQLTWGLNNLFSYGDTTFDYFYDNSRVYKKTGNNTVSFKYHDGQLLEEYRSGNDGTKNIKYFYDQSGIIGFSLNGTLYRYIKNLQGDIIAIYKGATKVAEYVYDAWGNCTIKKDTDGIGTFNAIRYRGYYYDVETGLYYLINRYYDPTTGRFISPDDVSYLDPETIQGLNLFAYCNNNPVMGVDPDGTLWHLLGAAAIGAFAGLAGRFVGDLLTGKWSSWQEYVGAAVGGAVAGAAIATGNMCGVAGTLKVVTTVVASMAGSLAADATTLSLNLVTNQETRSAEEVVVDVVENALLAGAFAFGGEAVGSLFSNTGSKLGTLLREASRYTAATFFKELGNELINSATEAVFDAVFYWISVIGGLIR